VTTFHIIHIIVGAWLAIVNFFNIFSPSTLSLNNIILGLAVALYNVYFLFARENVDARQENAS